MKRQVVVFCSRCGFAMVAEIQLAKVEPHKFTTTYYWEPTTVDHECEDIQDSTE